MLPFKHLAHQYDEVEEVEYENIPTDYDENGKPLYDIEPEGIVKIHKKIETRRCPRCGHIIKYEFKLVIDMSNNSIYIPLKCENCGLKFKVMYPFDIKY